MKLNIQEDRLANIVISFHALGFEFFGLLAASAFVQYSDKVKGQELSSMLPHVLCKEVFQFSDVEQEDSVIKRFCIWLEDVLLVGIEQWRKQL